MYSVVYMYMYMFMYCSLECDFSSLLCAGSWYVLGFHYSASWDHSSSVLPVQWSRYSWRISEHEWIWKSHLQTGEWQRGGCLLQVPCQGTICTQCWSTLHVYITCNAQCRKVSFWLTVKINFHSKISLSKISAVPKASIVKSNCEHCMYLSFAKRKKQTDLA